MATLQETVFSFHYSAKKLGKLIVRSLEYLQSKGDGKSGVQLSAILRFDFLLPLVIVEHILQDVVPQQHFKV